MITIVNTISWICYYLGQRCFGINSNKINSAHSSYLKTATDSVFSSLQLDVQKNAFVKSPQVGEGDLSWYLEGLDYSFSSEYDFNYNASMKFVDKKGVAATSLKY